MAVAVLAGGGTFLLTRSDNTAQPITSAATTVADSAVDTSLVEGPAATGTVVVPAGALDLGDGVYVPIDSSVELTGDDPYTITNHTSASTMIVQVVRREAGEDPNVLLQEYIDIFDADYTLVSYLPSRTEPPGFAGFDTLRFSSVAYVLYQPELEYPNVVGQVGVYMRNDGLTILADTYGSAANPLGDGAFNTLINSLAAAPAIAEPAAWFPAAAKMPDTIHATVDLPYNPARQLVLPQGFEVTARTANSVTADNQSDIVTAVGSLSVASAADAHSFAIEQITGAYSGGSVGTFVAGGSGALVFEKAPWSGKAADGTLVTGEVWLQFDAPSQTAVLLIVGHRTSTWDANAMAMMAASIAQSGPGAAGSAGGQ